MKDKIENWFYKLLNGHSRLFAEEAEIICEVRSDKENYWMDDYTIQRLIEIKIKKMYDKKFPKI